MNEQLRSEINGILSVMLVATIHDYLEDNNYIPREDLKYAFEAARDGLIRTFGDDILDKPEAAYTWIERGCKICLIPGLYIEIDPTGSTDLEFRFPSGDIIQRTTIKGFA